MNSFFRIRNVQVGCCFANDLSLIHLLLDLLGGYIKHALDNSRELQFTGWEMIFQNKLFLSYFWNNPNQIQTTPVTSPAKSHFFRCTQWKAEKNDNENRLSNNKGPYKWILCRFNLISFGRFLSFFLARSLIFTFLFFGRTFFGHQEQVYKKYPLNYSFAIVSFFLPL
jgi:hypothetical protein